MMAFHFSEFFSAFIMLFVILDPFVSMGVFAGLTRRADRAESRKIAFIATSVAFSLLAVFLLIGDWLFRILSIDFASFKIAGGIILLIMGVQQVFGLEFKRSHNTFHSAAVIIGTPLLAGPGALSTIMILQKEYGFLEPLLAIIVVCIITFLLLVSVKKMPKFLGPRMIEVMSRVLGLLLAAIAVGFIRDGVMLIIQTV
ncbi:MarC family protein [Candidatus Woesearchaeota archaeon]|nr:MarC family protein [Candidatus Woesearchaeota archaeon]